MIKAILLIGSLLGNSHDSQVDSDSVLTWCEERRLEWTDFRGKIDSKVSFGAISYVQINISFSIEMDSNIFVRYNWQVKTVFHKNKSWSKFYSGQQFQLLQHEQTHFDIGELFARRIREYLSLRIITKQNYDETGMKISEFLNEESEFERNYDDATEHGVNSSVQAEWTNSILKALGELTSFSIDCNMSSLH